MTSNLLWTGREYYSLENCLVHQSKENVHISSTIVGSYQSTLYRVEYDIKTDGHWLTEEMHIRCQIDDVVQNFSLLRSKDNAWILNNERVPEFDGCMYVDIPLTPFTNTLPINHLQLKTQEQAVIKVIYIDLLKDSISMVQQQYKCIDAYTYHYENIPNDFEADITVDDKGFVMDYPQLFVATKFLNS